MYKFEQSVPERNQINDAILALSRAKSATTEQEFTAAVQAAYGLTRMVIRGRLD